MIIRAENPNDQESIREIHVLAFKDHPHSQQTEHLIVDALRAAQALSLSLVAEVEGEVVGHIAFSPVSINGKDLGWFALGPVAVRPAFQKRGIGQSLINKGLDALWTQGAQGCVLVGDPHYYRRFGFRHTEVLKLEGVPPEVFMCIPAKEEIPAGFVEHHRAFHVQTE